MAANTLNNFPPGFQWLNLRRAMEQDPKPLDFVLPGLKSGTVGALVSPGATGKTMFTLQTALTVAGGPDMLGFASMDKSWRKTPGRVLFLTAEDPAEVLSHRFHALGKRLSSDEREIIFKNLSVAPLVGHNANMMSKEWRSWIGDVACDTRLIVVDTLRRFHQLDENDGSQMAALLGYMEQLCLEKSTTVLFLHHTSKAAALGGNGDSQHASRGSSVLQYNARFQAALIGMTRAQAKEYDVDDVDRCNYVMLSFTKINYSAPIKDCWYKRESGGVLVPVALATTNTHMPLKSSNIGERKPLNAIAFLSGVDNEQW